jgi:hypothetical protein
LANSYGVEYFREPTFPRVEATLGSNLRTPLEFNVEERSFGLFVQSKAAMYFTADSVVAFLFVKTDVLAYRTFRRTQPECRGALFLTTPSLPAPGFHPVLEKQGRNAPVSNPVWQHQETYQDVRVWRDPFNRRAGEVIVSGGDNIQPAPGLNLQRSV